MTQPQDSDVVLGGQVSPPFNSAILGGIEGLQQQLLIVDSDQRSHLLATAHNYGEPGIDVLISTLNHDPALTIRAIAYQQLQNALAEVAGPLLEKVQTAIAPGIPLKPGDVLYSVYQLSTEYDDEYYFIGNDSIPEGSTTDEDYFDIEEASSPQDIDWEALSVDEMEELYDQWGAPQLKSRHIFKESAEALAEQLHLKQVLDKSTPDLFEFDFVRCDRSEFDFNGWCEANGLPPIQLADEDWWVLGEKLVNQLKESQDVQLLSQLWKDTVGPLAITHEQVINRDCYFKFTRPL
jgi:hypothetical protein